MHTSLNKIAKSLRADKKKRSNGRRRNNDSNMCGETKKMGAGYNNNNNNNIFNFAPKGTAPTHGVEEDTYIQV